MSNEIQLIDERRGSTSASNAQADMLCPGRHQAQRGIKDESSSDATFGQMVHDALATDDPSKLTSEQHSVYDSCVEIRERLILDTFGPDADNAKRFKEQRYWSMVNNQWEHSGKPDLVVRSGSDALIVEYKCLPGDVEDSPSNLQLRDQAVMAAGALLLSKVTVAIIQPLVTYSPVLCQYDALALKQATQEMFDRVAASNSQDAERIPGESQCKFCRARHTCQERADFVSASAPVIVSSFSSVPVKEWTPEQRSAFCDRVGLLKKWIDECTSEMKQMLKDNPDSIPGWELEAGSIKTPVNKPEVLHQRFIEAGGTTEEFMSCVSIGKKDLEAIVRSATKLKGKALKSKIDELLDGVTDKKQDAPSLARKP